ncbi:hypothetical protein BU17DRAFT_97247 [Hysterangium stoloniferum]|nr:hypothetical protein BU17DRAFT_97247 [Hysterangium stoloniferum]
MSHELLSVSHLEFYHAADFTTVRTGSNQGVVAVQLGHRHHDIEDGSVGRVVKQFIKGNGLLDEHQKVIEFRQAEIAKLPPETRRLTQYMHNSQLPCSFESDIHGLNSDDWEDITQSGGLELSHEGGEFEHLFSNWKNVAKGHHHCKYTPGNTTHSQIEASKHCQDWEIQLTLLFEAYMEFKYGGDRIMTDISYASNTAGEIRMEQAQDEFTITVFGLEGMWMVADQAMEREAKQPTAKIRLIHIVREAWEVVLVL